jgi:hypothetical protein
MNEIIDKYNDAEVIEPKVAQQLLGRIRAKSATLTLTDYGCELSPDTDGYSVHFVQAEDGHGVQLEPNKGWLTVSYYFITFDGKKYEVDTGGPFHLEIDGLSEAVEKANN